jgi:hypothetical protein
MRLVIAMIALVGQMKEAVDTFANLYEQTFVSFSLVGACAEKPALSREWQR